MNDEWLYEREPMLFGPSFDYECHPSELNRWSSDGGNNVDDEIYFFGDEDLVTLNDQQQIEICKAIRRAILHIQEISLRERNKQMTAKERAGQFVTSLKRELFGFSPDVITEFCNVEAWVDAGVLAPNKNTSWRTVKFMDNDKMSFAHPLVDYAKSLPPDTSEEIGEISKGLDALRTGMTTFRMHIKNAVAINEESDRVVQNLTKILEDNEVPSSDGKVTVQVW